MVDSQHSLDLQKYQLIHKRLVLVQLQFLVLQFQDSQVRLAKAQFFTISRALLQSRSFIGYIKTLLPLVLLRFLEMQTSLYNTSLDTTETTKILAHRVDLHSPILLSYTHLSITLHIMELARQFFMESVVLLGYQGHSHQLSVQDPSRNLHLSMKHMQEEDIKALVLLTSLVLLQLKFSPLRKVDPTLLSYNV